MEYPPAAIVEPPDAAASLFAAQAVEPPPSPESLAIASGEKAKGRDILAAIRIQKRIEREQRPATHEERQTLARFPGFGAVARLIFPNDVLLKKEPNHKYAGYPDAGWQVLGEELKSLLTPEQYASARRTTFNAFYTSSTVIRAMFQALSRMGVPDNGLVLEPGCGPGRFPLLAPKDMRFIGVELDSISGRIAKALHPGQDIRIENFHDSRLPALDAMIGNVPFADKPKLEHKGQKFSLHDYFFAKSVDALQPGGVLALVTSHFTLDKQNAAIREYLADKADFLGAIRLPSDAFQREGTPVVTDIVFLRKRAPGEPARHADPAWLKTAPLDIDGAAIPINRYFHHHPEMVLGSWSRENTMYGTEGFSIVGNGDLARQLHEAVERLPRFEPLQATAATPAARFTPPPLKPHLDEGSLFIAQNGDIQQIVDGQAQPVIYRGKKLHERGDLMGRRLAALIRIKEQARRVLDSQNDGWPEPAREEERRELRAKYDRFSFAYGPINKTTFSETKNDTIIRRMPNLVLFRQDPDAMLVCSLEDYDEETGTAKKAAIMQKDVVGKHTPITHVTSAEDGLLASLDRTGGVDLAFIQQLYGKPEATIIEELGDLIYRDPESQRWQTADDYLSGNVRHKLKQAEAAGPAYARNALALKAVQPEDVLPGAIDAHLGAPWIPESDIQAFAAELFGVPADDVTVSHVKKDAVWSVEAGFAAQHSVAAKADYGTSRINGTTLLEQALNLKTPTIYDPDPNDPDKRIINQDETLAAREKQRAIKERFKSWIFADADRADRLVRIYNDTYNNLRPRIFDGSHLQFTGMNQTITLDPHQKNAVWRVMSSGNTLLAHCVGAGKTFEMAAAAMKLKQAGLAKKCLIAVPNHLLEQFAGEFQKLYPNAKLLVAAKEEFDKERRKHLTAKIASGDWDAIIVTHSSFERIGMSRKYQEQFLNEQIREYEDLIIEHAADKGGNRNIIKNLEKQKAAREEKLKDLMAEDKKDDGLTFDELGIDHIFIDEFHLFKNLETPTKMERVAGIQTGGSERAFDLYIKSRYLDQLHPGHGLTGATGTPISNTLVEIYTLQRYFDPEGLRSRGIDHFDGWAANFGEVRETMEISPDGKTLKPRSRFSDLVNYADLEQMYCSFADVQTAEMLNLPRPRLETGKPIVVSCPMSEEQRHLQDGLVRRYEKIRSTKVDPRIDNALKITTDGRKLALDARLLSTTALTPATSKLDLMIDIIADRWQRTAATRGTQMVFCDMGVHPTSWGFSVYDEIIKKLIDRGIPGSQIATIGEADSDAKKKVLFDKVRSGQVRILIGSTTKMGAGTNVQKRLGVLHHLDAPWKPAEVEQRDGRILRQGNDNEEVAIYRYVTEGSFDAYMWQTLETKARAFARILAGQSGLRRVEDIAGQELSYAEVKAIASGNPAVLTLAQSDAEIQRLSILQKSHGDEQYLARLHLKDLPGQIERLTSRAAGLSKDRATLAAHRSITIGNRPLSHDEAVIALSDRLDTLPLNVMETRYVDLGTYRGLTFGIILHPMGHPEIYLQGEAIQRTSIRKDARGLAVLHALDRLTEGYAEAETYTRQDLAVAEAQYRDYQQRIGKPFAHEDYLKQLTVLRDQLRAGLSSEHNADQVAELAGQIKALRGAHHVEAAPERTVQRRDAGEEPVTSRIRRRVEERVVKGGENGQESPNEGKWQRKLAEEARSRAERVQEPG